MARVKFIRDEEPNIRSLETNGGAIDGALYVATDTGNMWMGTDSNTLLKLSNPVIVEVDYTASKVTQEQHNTIAASWPNVIFKKGVFLYKPVSINKLNKAFSFSMFTWTSSPQTGIIFPKCKLITIYTDLSLDELETNLFIADPHTNNGYGIMSADTATLECSSLGKISIKDNGVTTAKITDGAVTKAKLGSDIVIPTTKADIGLENVDNTADANKSVKYATSAGSANTASVANSVSWDNVTGAPTIPDVSDYVKHEAINEYVTPDNKLNASLIAGTLGTSQIADGAITKAKIASGVIPATTPIATVSTAGKVKPDGKTITIASDGTISGASTYTLPSATESTLGGVYASVNSSAHNFTPLGSVFSQKGQGLVITSINDDAITTRNLANDAVTADKIADGVIPDMSNYITIAQLKTILATAKRESDGTMSFDLSSVGA